MIAIKAALDDGHITIPFPTQTLELGGASLSLLERAGVTSSAEPSARSAPA